MALRRSILKPVGRAPPFRGRLLMRGCDCDLLTCCSRYRRKLCWLMYGVFVRPKRVHKIGADWRTRRGLGDRMFYFGDGSDWRKMEALKRLARL